MKSTEKGILYGVGVGPGDPELMTLKAVRLIRENDVIAVPGRDPRQATAYRIAAANVPEIEAKTLIPVSVPMSRSRVAVEVAHRQNALLIEPYLERGKNVVYITLGDPTVYCTVSYLKPFLEKDGYTVELISGVSSFCAAAARLGTALAEWDEPLLILPAVHQAENLYSLPGNTVLMKSASHMKEVKELLRKDNKTVMAVENCGMKNEKIYRTVNEIPDDAGYFTLILSKDIKK